MSRFKKIDLEESKILDWELDNSLLIEYTKNMVFAISPQCDEGQVPAVGAPIVLIQLALATGYLLLASAIGLI